MYKNIYFVYEVENGCFGITAGRKTENIWAMPTETAEIFSPKYRF